MRFKACIFDLDGTLCDTIESISHCANQTLCELGLKPSTPEEYKIFVGDGVDMLMRRLLKNAGDPEGLYFDVMKKRYSDLFGEGCLYNVKPYPGIPDALEELKERGVRLAVLSNKQHANTAAVIRHTFGDGTFDAVLGQSERFPIKPDPAAALHIAAGFGVRADECLYLGDTWTDMKTGKAAGMYTVGVLWGFRGEEELKDNGADLLISSASEIPALCFGERMR